MRVGRREVRLTHPDKELWPGISKQRYAQYMRDVAPAMVPHTRDRPLSMQRFRDGVGSPGFFQKDIGRGAPDWVKRVAVEKQGGKVCHPLANDAPTLVWLAQVNCLTPHVFPRRADRLDRPDRLIVDLDPSVDDFAAVRTAARQAGELLRELGLEPFAMTTGSRGLHVVAPLKRTRDVDDVLAFARALAAELAARHPRALTTEFHKVKRDDRIYVDVGRNGRAQTAVPPYAARALPSAPVATPLHWEELADRKLRPDGWTLRTVLERLETLGGDPWAGIGKAARALPRS
jgi:bifunctional non-homologous end joining protein LigD